MLDLLKRRRSIRKYANKEIEKEKVLKLVQGALLSPSSRNLRPWEFVVVEDKAILEKLSHSKPGGGFLKNAELGIVILGNPEISDVWIEDTSIASSIIHLLSYDLGLGSCWIQIRERNHDDSTSAEEYVRQILGIPEHLKVLSILALGYPDEIKPANSEEDLHYEKVHLNNYGSKFVK